MLGGGTLLQVEGVVPILARETRQIEDGSILKSGVVNTQFRQENPVERYAVKNDVVQREAEAVLLSAHTEEAAPEERKPVQRNGIFGILVGRLQRSRFPPFGGQRSEIHNGNADRQGRSDNLHQFAVTPLEG